MKKFLFIDDNQDTLDLLEDLYSCQGMVFTATDAPTALYILNQQSIDEVYVDVLLASEANGYVLAQEIKQSFPLKKLHLLTSLDKEFVRETYGTEFDIISKMELVLTAPA